MIRWCVAVAVAAGVLCAQDWSLDLSAAGTDLALRRLQTDVRVLYITAHPDDEDAALLTALARGRAYRVALLTLSRGEGGANLAGPEMGDALGALRTEELLAANRYYGVEQFFTRAVDFGFSKRLDETFEHWPREEVLRDAVRVTRMFRPEIIIARFHGAARDGHGNHQAAGVIAREVWDAAADPARFPEAGPAWKAQKLYRSVRGKEPRTLGVNTDIHDPLSGSSLRELAVTGYRQHRTQAMAASDFQFRGGPVSGLELVASRVGPVRNEDDIAEGPGFVSRPPIAWDARKPWEAAPQLLRMRPVTAELSDAMRRVLGIRVEAVVDGERTAVVPGESVTVQVSVRHYPQAGLKPVSTRLDAPSGWTVTDVGAGRFRLVVPDDARPTRPHWQAEPGTGLYRIDRPEIAHLPFPPPEVVAEYRYQVEGTEFTVRQPVQVQTLDPLYGPQRRNLTVVPAVNLSVSPRVAVVPRDRRQVTVRVDARTASKTEGVVRLKLPPGWKATPAEAPLGSSAEFRVDVGPEGGRIEAEAVAGARRWTEGYEMAGYRGLEPHALYRPATVDVRAVDLKVAPGLRVGYIAGAGDSIPEALAQLGVPVQPLAEAELASADLARFHAIVVGVRASAVRPDFRANRERLLEYVRSGGHLIVQYQTWEFDSAQWGPWPYEVRREAEEVSEEKAAVTILDPEHPVLRWPNRITSADFDGWVEERGSKFMTTWDRRYTALLESHDRGQAPQKGGLVTTTHGSGRWTYAAYAFYRQLPAGVPGAWRLFANLLSAGRDPGTPSR